MLHSRTFHPFKRLPPEIQDKIWQFHRQHRGIRHYLTQTEPVTRHYAAIDIETNRFVRTLVTHGTASKFWDEDDKPIRGESDAKICLVGTHTVFTSGCRAESPTTVKGSPVRPLLSNVNRPRIRINYKTDVVVLESHFVCLQPAFKLQHRLPFQRADLENHWLRHVQRLAISTSGCRMGVERRIAALPSLEHLYLVVYRDPECWCGAPLRWKNFDKSLLDVHKFLAFDDFVDLHRSYTTRPCDCELNGFRANEILATFLRAFDTEGVQDMKISIVADPY
ncbi:hypothetical protein F5Y09DRAFT_264350 [Xylaria sp. FL1042]|nr:hypothetical protein F5Y09DRAFT_264350 [Xylaria sp. FL1042]